MLSVRPESICTHVSAYMCTSYLSRAKIEAPKLMPSFLDDDYHDPIPYDAEKHFLHGQSERPGHVRILFPGLATEDGEVWQGVKAYVVCV
jgi:hypothetical protein